MKWRWRYLYTIFMTSQSIEGKSFPDFETLDARIASALRRVISNASFIRRVSVEEQRAQTYDRFLRGTQMAFLIYVHFQSTGASDAAQGLSDLFNICLQNDDVQDFDTRWDQTFLGTSEMPPENVLEGLYKNKLQDSEQLQTLFAMYNQDLSRDRVTPSCQRLRKMVRQQIDQMIRTRKFKARNQRNEAGVLVNSQKKGEMSAHCSKSDSCCFFKRGLILVNEHNHLLLLLLRRLRLMEESLVDFRSPRGASLSGLKGRKPCQSLLKGKCTESPSDLWHPPRAPKLQV